MLVCPTLLPLFKSCEKRILRENTIIITIKLPPLLTKIVVANIWRANSVQALFNLFTASIFIII